MSTRPFHLYPNYGNNGSGGSGADAGRRTQPRRSGLPVHPTNVNRGHATQNVLAPGVVPSNRHTGTYRPAAPAAVASPVADGQPVSSHNNRSPRGDATPARFPTSANSNSGSGGGSSNSGETGGGIVGILSRSGEHHMPPSASVTFLSPGSTSSSDYEAYEDEEEAVFRDEISMSYSSSSSSSSPTTSSFSCSTSSSSDEDEKDDDVDSIASSASRAPAKRRRRDHRLSNDSREAAASSSPPDSNSNASNNNGRPNQPRILPRKKIPKSGKRDKGVLGFRQICQRGNDSKTSARARARRAAEMEQFRRRRQMMLAGYNKQEPGSVPPGYKGTKHRTPSDDSDSDSDSDDLGMPNIGSDSSDMSELFFRSADPRGELRNDANVLYHRAAKQYQRGPNNKDDYVVDDSASESSSGSDSGSSSGSDSSDSDEAVAGNTIPQGNPHRTHGGKKLRKHKNKHKDDYVTGNPEEGVRSLDRTRARSGAGTDAEQEEEEEEDVVPQRTGLQVFLDQFYANSGRMIVERKRSLLMFASEIIIPVMFLVVTVIAGVALKTFSYDEMQPLDYNNPVVIPLMQSPQRQFMCASDTAIRSDGRSDLPLVPGLPLCEDADFPSVNCDGDDSTLPVRGLCFRGDLSGREAVLVYVGQLMGNLSYVPDFDTIVLYQWLARKTMSGAEDAIQQTLAAAGFISNTVANVILRSGLLHFAPNSAVVADLVDYLNESTTTFRYVYGETFESNDAARDSVQSSDGLTWGIINVKAMTDKNFDVLIQLNETALPKFVDRIDPLYSGGFQMGRAELYFTSGFLTLQKMLYNFYVERVVQAEELAEARSGFVPYFMTMGSVPYKQNQMLLSASFIISFITTNAFLYPVTMMAKKIVSEKELRLEEAMYIMGMGQLPRVVSFVVLNFIFLLLLCALMAMVAKCGFQSQSDFFIIYLVFVIYSLACISLALFLASFFSKTRLVVLVAPLAYFVMTVPIFAINNAPGRVIMGLSWLPPTAFAGLLSVMYQHDVRGGFRNEHFFDPLDDPKVGHQIFILLGDTVFYFILALYFENVLPKDCGTPKHPLFFLIDPIRAWCCKKKYDREGGPDGRDPDGIYEDDEEGREWSVEVVGLRKEYKRNGKKFCAVDNLYLNFAVGGISILLGHNGAGKSTAFNMMDGMTKPDAGDCFVHGVSVRDNLMTVRQGLGFCPQHNILWPDLTCREHLEFFGKIKGLCGAELEDAVQRILQEVDLLDKSEYRARELSGGMKRKLSVAIAFVGGSHLVFLDEPTGGMDVAARRHTWELLLRMSVSRTILLTTHFMDEADLLGDFVAIMAHGRLKCAGSSLFLKSRLGVGYNISLSVFAQANHAAVENLILSTIEGADSLERKGLEAQYQLPASEADCFPALLKAIEKNSGEYGIRGYALSATTLEEVFMKVAEEGMKHDDDAADGGGGGGDANSPQRDADGGGGDLTEQQDAVWNCELLYRSRDIAWMQFVTSMKKRFWNAKRDRRMICFQVVCPIICVLIAMLLNLIKFSDSATLDYLDPYYTQTEVLFSGCDDIWGFPAPSYQQQQSLTLTNTSFLNAQDMNGYLIDSWYRHREPGRYMAYSCNDADLKRMLSVSGLAPVASSSMPFTPVVGMYNVSSEHEVAAAMMHMYSSRLMKQRPGTGILKTTAQTLPATKLEETVNGGLTSILIGCMIMIPFTFLPSNCVAWIVKERECKSRHLQNLIGLRFLVYWVSNFLFDMAAYLVTMFIVIIIFAIFQRKEYIGTDAAGATIVLFLVYGIAGTTAAYALNFFFSHAPTAQTTVMIAGFASGFLLVMLVFIFNMVLSTQHASRVMRWPFRLIPTYCVGEAIINMATIEQTKLNDPAQTQWSMSVIGWPCVYMVCEIPVFIALTLLIDHPGMRKRRERRAYHPHAAPDYASGEDTDVEEEREQTLLETDYLMAGARRSQMTEDELDDHPEPDPVSVVHLKKVYPNGKVAVRDLTFTVMPGEVFGFLGTNGAGKTTAISVMCQEFLPTSGHAFIGGYDIVEEAGEALKKIGYCPQFDATLDLLTVEEHLRVFAGVRGIVGSAHDEVIQALLDICDLNAYRKVLAGELSGGNRRKLSVAMSLVGGPQVVFLDEPSAGMDPIARRGLWASISTVGEMCSIVLTTHHLEEVEALADTVAIMVDGGLRCIGSKTHLKNKYGSGFEMSLRVESADARLLVEHFIAENFPDAQLNEYRTGRFVYALPQTTLLSDVFALLQEHKDIIGITDYTVSQTSIEQVFMRISEEAAAAEAAAVAKKGGNSRRSFNILPW